MKRWNEVKENKKNKKNGEWIKGERKTENELKENRK